MSMVNIEGDMRGVTNVMGMFNSIIETFSNKRNLETMTSLGAEAAIQGFNEAVDAMAGNREDELGHMYDWGELGQESGRLWRVILGGTQTNKIATFDYKQSENEVPVGVNDEDTRQGGHVFRWKAPIIENGIRVKINPVNGEWLAIPTAENSSNMTTRTSKGGTMWFSRGTVSPPINRQARGAFTQMWLTHFATAAIRIVDEVVVEEVEEFIESYDTEIKRLPKAKVNPKARKSKLKVKSLHGEKIGRRKNGQFMNKQERLEQTLRLQRIGDGLA